MWNWYTCCRRWHTHSFIRSVFLNRYLQIQLVVWRWWQRRRRQQLRQMRLTHLHPNWLFEEDTQKWSNNNTMRWQDWCNSLMFDSQIVSFSISNARTFNTVLCAHSIHQFVCSRQIPNKNKSQKMIFLLRFFMLRNLTNSTFLCSFSFIFYTVDLKKITFYHMQSMRRWEKTDENWMPVRFEPKCWIQFKVYRLLCNIKSSILSQRIHTYRDIQTCNWKRIEFFCWFHRIERDQYWPRHADDQL